jgi:hypothetical protein
MSVRIRFLTRRKIVVSVVHGTLAFEDLLEHRRRMASNSAYDPSYRLLFDARRVENFTVTGDEIRSFADFSQPGQPRFSRMAMLVSSDLGYGLARIFQAYTGRHNEKSLMVFRDAREAWNWLTQD